MLHKLFRKFKSTTAEPDAFITRIRSLVIGEGMLKEGNISLMDFAIRNMPAEGSVVEIGSYGGLSTNVILYLMGKHQKNNPFFTCDAWIYEGYQDHLQNSVDAHIDGRSDVLRTDYSNYIKQAFINATKFLSPKYLPHSFHQYSDSFFDHWNQHKADTDVFGRTVKLGGNISFAYLDGDHSYTAARNDFNHIVAHLLPQGFVLLDDSADGQRFGSARLMADIKRDKRFKVIAKNPNYLVQKL